MARWKYQLSRVRTLSSFRFLKEELWVRSRTPESVAPKLFSILVSISFLLLNRPRNILNVSNKSCHLILWKIKNSCLWRWSIIKKLKRTQPPTKRKILRNSNLLLLNLNSSQGSKDLRLCQNSKMMPKQNHLYISPQIILSKKSFWSKWQRNIIL